MHQPPRVDAEDRPRFRLVRITGEIDVTNVRRLATALEEAIPNDGSVVAVDLSGTSYIDSVGIQLLFTVAERFRDRRRELRLVVPDAAPIRAVLELTALTRTVPAVATVDALDASIRRG